MGREVNYSRRYIQNLLISLLVVVALGIFLSIFYPDTLILFAWMGQFATLLKLWPLPILLILVLALPGRNT